MTDSEVIRELQESSVLFTQNLLKIRNKQGFVIPFILNPIQRKILQIKRDAVSAGRPRRFIILKARRTGVTTLEQAMNFHAVSIFPNTQAVTLAHESESTEKIFRIANLFYECLPNDRRIKPRRLAPHNKRDLNFPELNSHFGIGTAGGRGFGRGDTLQRAHWSEVAWSPGGIEDQRNLLAGLTEAASEGEVVLESTPNGMGDLFCEKYSDARAGRNEWTPIFMAWWDDPTNRLSLTGDVRREMAASMSNEERILVRTHALTIEQIAWRRSKQRELKQLFKQEYPEDDVSCFLTSGLHFFDPEKVQALLKGCAEPIETRESGAITIWKKPVADRMYVAGGDVAEGTPSGDFSFLGIFDYETCEQVAAFHARVRPETFGVVAEKLCREYNIALLGVEANNHGHSTLNTLRNSLKYPRLFEHRNYDSKPGNPTKKLGWQTNSKTRPLLLDGLRVALEDGLIKINDREFLAECLTFCDDGTGKYEARQGFYDDRIMGWGISWQLRQQPLRTPAVSLI